MNGSRTWPLLAPPGVGGAHLPSVLLWEDAPVGGDPLQCPQNLQMACLGASLQRPHLGVVLLEPEASLAWES